MTGLRGTLSGALALIVAAGLIGATSQGAAAQQTIADEWLPWLGCWQAVDAPADAPLTCVRPAAGGLELLAVSADGVVESRAIRAGGVAGEAMVGGCPATERAELSRDGSRIYLETERACPGEPVRLTRGMIAMVDQDRWIEAQAMEVRGRTVAWVQRYEPAPRARAQALGQGDLLALVDQRGGIIAAARSVAAERITVDQIIEAHGRTDTEIVRVWVAEQLRPPHLDADGLIRMANAGVADEVIDVAVAVAYPDRFAVARDEPYYPRTRGPRGPARPPGYPPLYPGWDPYYGYWGRGWGPYYRPTVVVVTPRDGNRGFARLIKGRGYTRGGATTASGGGSDRTPDRPATSKPSSGGDRSATTGRRAQPRDN